MLKGLKQIEEDLSLFPAFIKLLFGIFGELSETLKIISKKYNLTRQDSRILWNLDPDKPLSHVELANRVILPKSSITETIKKLETQGLVKKASASYDERVSLISLTEKGHRVRHEMLGEWSDKRFFAAYKSLSLQERREFNGIAAHMAENLLGSEFVQWATTSSGIQRYIAKE